MQTNVILQGDALTRLKGLPSDSIDCVITSPPYWALRDYGVDGQLGLEPTFNEYLEKLLAIFDEIKRVLKPTGTLWVNLGDTYSGSGGAGGDYKAGGLKEGQPEYQGSRKQYKQDTMKHLKDNPAAHRRNPYKSDIRTKSLLAIPDRFKIAMIDSGWICRNELIWYKRNCMPSSAKDRFTVDFEKIFFFTKSERYYFETQYEPYAPSSIERVLQPTFDQQKGGPKDHATAGINNNTSARRTIEHLATKIKFGGNKAAGYGNPTYSGKPWIPKVYREQYTGQATKDYDSANAQNPSDTKRRILESIQSGEHYGRLKRCVWDITTKGFSGAHFATFPEDLLETPIKAGCPEYVCKKCGKPRQLLDDAVEEERIATRPGLDVGNGKSGTDDDPNSGLHNSDLSHKREQIVRTVDKSKLSDCGCGAGFDGGVVLDPFFGSGTTGLVALKHGRRFVGIELNAEYITIAEKRLAPYMRDARLF